MKRLVLGMGVMLAGTYLGVRQLTRMNSRAIRGLAGALGGTITGFGPLIIAARVSKSSWYRSYVSDKLAKLNTPDSTSQQETSEADATSAALDENEWFRVSTPAEQKLMELLKSLTSQQQQQLMNFLGTSPEEQAAQRPGLMQTLTPQQQQQFSACAQELASEHMQAQPQQPLSADLQPQLAELTQDMSPEQAAYVGEMMKMAAPAARPQLITTLRQQQTRVQEHIDQLRQQTAAMEHLPVEATPPQPKDGMVPFAFYCKDMPIAIYGKKGDHYPEFTMYDKGKENFFCYDGKEVPMLLGHDQKGEAFFCSMRTNANFGLYIAFRENDESVYYNIRVFPIGLSAIALEWEEQGVKKQMLVEQRPVVATDS